MNVNHDFMIINHCKVSYSYSKMRKYIPNYISVSFYKISKIVCSLHPFEKFQWALEAEDNWILCTFASLANLNVFLF